MLVLGIILVLLSAGAVLAVVASGADDQAALYGSSVELPTLVVFLAGATVLLLFLLGLELIRVGFRQVSQNRQNTKKLRWLERREEVRRERAAAASAETGPGTPAPAGGNESPDLPAGTAPGPVPHSPQTAYTVPVPPTAPATPAEAPPSSAPAPAPSPEEGGQNTATLPRFDAAPGPDRPAGGAHAATEPRRDRPFQTPPPAR